MNTYYEHRRWVFFWGIFFSPRKEIQKALNKANESGHRLVHFERNTVGNSMFQIILIVLVTLFSLGIVSYWAGFSMILERYD